MRFVAVALALLIVACSPTVYDHGVPNLVEVEPGIWRSGQPTTAEGWSYLRTLGIRHVIKLNYEREGSDDGARAAGLDVHALSIPPDSTLQSVFTPIDAAVIAKAESVIKDGGGVLVHCTHGQDRTGLVVGLWRVLHDGWTRERAYDEMLAHHFHPILHNLREFWEHPQ